MVNFILRVFCRNKRIGEKCIKKGEKKMSKAVWRTERRSALELKLPGVHRWGRRP